MRELLKLPTLKVGRTVAILATVMLALGGGITSAAAQATETVLYSFAGGTADGAQPDAGLALDTSTGNLYGATFSGGAYGQGVVFELPSGTTSDTVLCNLPGGSGPGALNGAGPWGTPVFYSGNVYGTAIYNNNTGSSATGDGVIYECGNSGGTTYTYSVLHQFSGTDGANPWAGPTLDSGHSNLYGPTVNGGASSDGTLYKQPIAGTLSTLYSFTGGTGAGAQPYGGLAFDSAGNLAGATTNGGTLFAGIVYAASTSPGTPTIAHNFGSGSNYGFIARGNVSTDSVGDHYGTTMLGGSASNGIVYNLFQIGSRYLYSLLHTFAGGPNDGAQPWSGVVRDSSGNLYGSTESGGTSGYGVVYELSPNGTGYTETILWNFAGGTSDGANP